jgi:hypothetical protein
VGPDGDRGAAADEVLVEDNAVEERIGRSPRPLVEILAAAVTDLPR